MGGSFLLDEESFYAATTRIKKTLSYALRPKVEFTPFPNFERMESLERFVESGTTRLLGRVWMSDQELEEHLSIVEADLSAHEEPPLVWQELRQLVAASQPTFGKVALDEANFYAITARLKQTLTHKALPSPTPEVSSYPSWYMAVIESVNAFEVFVEERSARLFGRVLVPLQNYEAHVEAVRASLAPVESLLPD